MNPIRSIGHSTPLGRWVMHECQPAGLRHVIESIWEVQGTVANPRERIFPAPSVDVLINLGPPQRLIGDGRIETFHSEAAWLSGVQSEPLVIESPLHIHMFSIRFRPGAASVVFAAPMEVASGRVLPLHELRRGATTALHEGVRQATSFRERVAVACRWIEDRHLRFAGVNYVQWISSALDRSGGTSSIEQLRHAAGVSRKKLAADFRGQVGVTPKMFARLLRFRRARTLLQGPAPSLTDAALTCGYFDQPHMIREFRELGGMTPGEFLDSCYPDGQSAVV